MAMAPCTFQHPMLTAWLLSVLILLQGGESSFVLSTSSLSGGSKCTVGSKTSSSNSVNSSSRRVWGASTASTNVVSTRYPSNQSSLFLSGEKNQSGNSPQLQTNTGSGSNTDEDKDEPLTTTNNGKGEIQVSTEIELPFPKTVAYDAFSDLSRQSTFSPWLKSVIYLNGAEQNSVGTITRWTLSYWGLRFSWNAVSTKQDRENGIIEWMSVTGMRNNGRVEFQDFQGDGSGNGDGDNRIRTIMKLTMTFTTPRFAARILGESTKVAHFVENRILKSTMLNFRQVIMDNDWKQMQQDEQPDTRPDEVHGVTTQSTRTNVFEHDTTVKH